LNAKAKETEASEEYWSRLRDVETKLDTLIELLTQPERPERIKNAGRRSGVIGANSQTALRARIGRAAKQHGMTMAEWVDRYGEVDRLPDAVRDQQSLPLEAQPPSRSPGKSAKGKSSAQKRRSRAGSK